MNLKRKLGVLVLVLILITLLPFSAALTEKNCGDFEHKGFWTKSLLTHLVDPQGKDVGREQVTFDNHDGNFMPGWLLSFGGYGTGCSDNQTIVFEMLDDLGKIYTRYKCPCYNLDGIERYCLGTFKAADKEQLATFTRCYSPHEHPAVCKAVGGFWSNQENNACCGDESNENWDPYLRTCCADSVYNKNPKDSCCDPSAVSGLFQCTDSSVCDSCSEKGPCYCPFGCEKEEGAFVSDGQKCGKPSVCGSCTSSDSVNCRCPDDCLRPKNVVVSPATTCGGSAYTIKYTYVRDILGNILSIVTPLNLVKEYVYNNVGWIRRVVDPNLGITSFSRNKAGLVANYTSPSGVMWNITLDALGRSVLTWTGGGPPESETKGSVAEKK